MLPNPSSERLGFNKRIPGSKISTFWAILPVMHKSCEELIRSILPGLNEWLDAPSEPIRKAQEFKDSILEAKPKNHKSMLKELDQTIADFRISRCREAAEILSKVLREVEIYMEPSAPPARRGRKPGSTSSKPKARA